MLCTTDCFPCSTRHCSGRTCPGQNGLCKVCFGVNSTATARTRSSHFIPCVNVGSGCKAMLPSSAAAKNPVCLTCTRLGLPCASVNVGCKNRIANKAEALCAVCLRQGEPCRGPDGLGCRNRWKSKNTSQFRRALPGTHGQCFKCLRPTCTATGCRARSSPRYLNPFFCVRHGREMSAPASRKKSSCSLKKKRALETTSLPLPMKRQNTMLQCVVEWIPPSVVVQKRCLGEPLLRLHSRPKPTHLS